MHNLWTTMTYFGLLWICLLSSCVSIEGETYDYVCSCPPFTINRPVPCRLTIMAGDLPTNVNISTTYGDRLVSLQPGQTAFEQLDARLTVWREVEYKAIVVTSDAPIHLSVDRMDTYSSEPRYIDSTQMLANKAYDQELYEYFVISYNNPVIICYSADTTMFYTIASSQNNVQVDVYNKSMLVKSVTLYTHQTYTYGQVGSIDEDITGLRIVTSKPASVISGNMCTYNPGGNRNSVFTSVQPVAFDKYVAPVLGNSHDTGYTLRAIAVNNSSLITVNNVSYVINQGEFVNEELDGRTEPSFIECDSMCTAYLMTKAGAGIYDIGLGFISIIPLSQYYSSVFFSTLQYSFTHFVSIVAEGQGPYTDITLNGTALSDKPWNVMQDFSYVWFEVSFGSYRVESSTVRKMAVYVYGHAGYGGGGYAHSVWPADDGVEAGSTTEMTTTTVSPPGMSTLGDPKAVEIDSINPLQGIQAGGTQLTLLGKNFPPQINIYIGENPVVNEMACQNTMCFVHSPAVNTSFINTPLSIAVQFDGKGKRDTGFKFTYKANPSIRSIHPLETLIDGGTTITVTGESLAAVGDPTLQVITVHTILNTAKNTTASFESRCTASSDKEMKCVTPNMTVPDQFIPTQKDSKRKQEGGDLIFEIENERLDVYLGFKLDGDDTYGNVSESLPELGRFAVFVLQPECEPFDGVRRLEPESSLSVRGKRLDHGLRASDYRIRVGDSEVCHVVDLTSNSIVCELPALSHNVEYGITVHPGVNLEAQFIGHVEISTNPLYYIMGGSIAGGILIIITTTIVICVLVRRHKEQMVERRAREAFDTDIVDSVRRDPAETARHGIPLQGAV